MRARKSSIQSNRGRLRRVIVVGAGAAGLMTTWRLCEGGIPVLLVSRTPARRALSAAAQSGLNACLGLAEGDSVEAHLEDSLVAGELLAHRPPVRGMAETAPRLVELMAAIGVPFARTADGRLSPRHLAGSRAPRTAHVATTTGQHVISALDEQVRRLETVDVTDNHGASIPGEKMVERLESHELVSLVLDDDGAVSGVVTADVRTLRVQAFAGDAVCLATGGYAGLFGRRTTGVASLGAATGVAFRQGAIVANPELIEIHPMAVAGSGAALPGDALLSAGARLWVKKSAADSRLPGEVPERERDYPLERLRPARAGLFSDQIARAVLRAIEESGGLNDGSAAVPAYLDVTHLAPAALRSMAPALELYEKLTGRDPCAEPMEILPAAHVSLGGLWVDFEATADGSLVTDSPRSHATSLPGLYACGEADYQYHGARRLPGNGLLSCLYGGLLAANGMIACRDSMARSAFDLPGSVFDKQEADARGALETLLERATEGEGPSPFAIRDDLGDLLDRGLFAERDDRALDELIAGIDRSRDQIDRSRIADGSTRMNRSLELLRQLGSALPLARAAAMGALGRDECRGCHHKPARQDASQKGEGIAAPPKTTLARTTGSGDIELLERFEYQCAGSTISVTGDVTPAMRPPDSTKADDERSARKELR